MNPRRNQTWKQTWQAILMAFALLALTVLLAASVQSVSSYVPGPSSLTMERGRPAPVTPVH